MATGRRTDSAMAVRVCVSVLSQTPTGFNTAGTAMDCLDEVCSAELDSNFRGESVSVDLAKLYLTFTWFRLCVMG